MRHSLRDSVALSLAALAIGLTLGVLLTSALYGSSRPSISYSNPWQILKNDDGNNRIADYNVRHTPGQKILNDQRKIFRPISLTDEYVFKKGVLVGVLTQQKYLATRAKAVYETWGKEVDKLIFFVDEDCNISADLSHLPIVKLEGVPDGADPPLMKTFAMMKYMYLRHINEFDWFIRADDDMYLRADRLKDLLNQMNPCEPAYLGRPSAGRREDLERSELLPHERYCMGGSGVVLSNGAMRGLGPHLDNCLNAGMQHAYNTIM